MEAEGWHPVLLVKKTHGRLPHYIQISNQHCQKMFREQGRGVRVLTSLMETVIHH